MFAMLKVRPPPKGIFYFKPDNERSGASHIHRNRLRCDEGLRQIWADKCREHRSRYFSWPKSHGKLLSHSSGESPVLWSV